MTWRILPFVLAIVVMMWGIWWLRAQPIGKFPLGETEGSHCYIYRSGEVRCYGFVPWFHD